MSAINTYGAGFDNPTNTCAVCLGAPKHRVVAGLCSGRAHLYVRNSTAQSLPGKHTRLFVRGGFADVSAAGLILLAETAIPIDELSADRLSGEIKNAEEDLADAAEDQKRLAQEKLDRLKELKDALKI